MNVYVNSHFSKIKAYDAPRMKLPPDADSESSSANDSGTQSQPDVDFSDYMWMGEEMEEFDSKCIQELCEEAFIESCFEELFEEEDQFAEELEQFLSSLTQEQVGNLVRQLDAVSLDDSDPSPSADVTAKDEALSILNPEAEVFVPSTDQDTDSTDDK